MGEKETWAGQADDPSARASNLNLSKSNVDRTADAPPDAAVDEPASGSTDGGGTELKTRHDTVKNSINNVR
jgi:hypothetical protein